MIDIMQWWIRVLHHIWLGVSGFRVPWGSVPWERTPLDNSFLRVSERAGVVRYTFSFVLRKVTIGSQVLFPGSLNPARVPCRGTHLTIPFCAFSNPLGWLDILFLSFWGKSLCVPAFPRTESPQGFGILGTGTLPKFLFLAIWSRVPGTWEPCPSSSS
jgi:hypothetical protein